MSKRQLGETDLAKVDAYKNTPADYEEIPELTDDFIEHASRNGLIRFDRLRSLTIYSDLIDRLHGLGPDWQARANDALREWLDKIGA